MPVESPNDFNVVCQLTVTERRQSEEPSEQERGQKKFRSSLGTIEAVGSNYPGELLLLRLKKDGVELTRDHLVALNRGGQHPQQ